MSITYSSALAAAKRAGLPLTAQNPAEEWIQGHKWKFIYDHIDRKGELRVAIGLWWRQKRAFKFHSPNEFTYDVQCDESAVGTIICQLEIENKIELSYGQLGINRDVSNIEYYDDVFVEATGTWSGSETDRITLVHHPSMRFHLQQNVDDIQFSTEWDSAPIPKKWSDPFTLSTDTEVAMRNTAIWLFEKSPVETYSLYELNDGDFTPMGSERLRNSMAAMGIAFQLSSSQMEIMPPKNLSLKSLIIDPKWAQGG